MSGFLLPVNEGPRYEWHGAVVHIKASSRDTLGQLAVMEFRYPAGLSVHAHVHDGEDEMFYVVDGRLEGFCGDDQWVAEPGGFVFVPRDCLHGFVVAGDAEARALVMVGPPRVDSHVVRAGTPIT